MCMLALFHVEEPGNEAICMYACVLTSVCVKAYIMYVCVYMCMCVCVCVCVCGGS